MLEQSEVRVAWRQNDVMLEGLHLSGVTDWCDVEVVLCQSDVTLERSLADVCSGNLLWSRNLSEPQVAPRPKGSLTQTL